MYALKVNVRLWLRRYSASKQRRCPVSCSHCNWHLRRRLAMARDLHAYVSLRMLLGSQYPNRKPCPKGSKICFVVYLIMCYSIECR